MSRRKRSYLGAADTEWATAALQRMLQSKTRSQHQIMGLTGNLHSDGFMNTTYVDIAGATNLDSATAGLLKPVSSGIDSNTVLLLHGEGANNSTTFTDSASGALTVTPSGNAKISTTQLEFGSASMSFDGTNSYLSVPDSSFSIGTGDFTFDCWVRFNVLSTDQNVFFLPLASDGIQVYRANSGGKWNIYSGTASTAGSVTPVINTWYHVALVRVSGVLYLYINGVLDAQAICATAIASSTMRIGAHTANVNWLNGYLDEVRVSKIARWTANFTPPVAAYATGYNNAIVRSSQFTLNSIPLNARAAMLVNEVDAAVAGTDYTLEASRDDGTNYGAFTLTERFTTPEGYRFVTAEHPGLAALASGQNGRIRFKNLNNKNVQLAGWDVEFHPA